MKTTEQVNDIIKRAITRGAKPSPTPASRVKARRALLDAQVAALRSAIADIRARARETPAWAHGYNSAVTAIELRIAGLQTGATAPADHTEANLEMVNPAPQARAKAAPEGCTSDGWISVGDRLPAFAEDAEDDGVKVYTWDGELVTEDEFMPEYEQPAGPAIGGWMRTGEWFASDNLNRVTHWMPRRLPAAPAATPGDKP